ncbi:MAG: hypothetical protein GX154_01870 [Clostridiales bacterium]|nr:hypothetical protein [Clostridiales bacterium]
MVIFGRDCEDDKELKTLETTAFKIEAVKPKIENQQKKLNEQYIRTFLFNRLN